MYDRKIIIFRCTGRTGVKRNRKNTRDDDAVKEECAASKRQITRSAHDPYIIIPCWRALLVAVRFGCNRNKNKKENTYWIPSERSSLLHPRSLSASTIARPLHRHPDLSGLIVRAYFIFINNFRHKY